MFKSRIKKLEERVEALENAPVPSPVKIEVSCKSIGENIKSRRKNVGMSQNELASAIGVSVPMVCQIERGTKSVTLRLAADMAKVLQCDVNDFLSEKGE